MTDELRAKFELHCEKYARNLSLRRHPERDYWYEETRQAWELWKAAHASRDAEVEALRKDAERYRWLVKNAEIIECHHWHWWNHDSDVTPIAERIDAAMREESK